MPCNISAHRNPNTSAQRPTIEVSNSIAERPSYLSSDDITDRDRCAYARTHCYPNSSADRCAHQYAYFAPLRR